MLPEARPGARSSIFASFDTRALARVSMTVAAVDRSRISPKIPVALFQAGLANLWPMMSPNARNVKGFERDSQIHDELDVTRRSSAVFEWSRAWQENEYGCEAGNFRKACRMEPDAQRF
jgi:hypothetical protein